MSTTTTSDIHRGVLGNVLFSFALTGSFLSLIVLGNLLNYFSSPSLVILCMVTFLRTCHLIYALKFPIKKRLPRLTPLVLTVSGLIAFNYAFPLVVKSLQYLILELFLDQWSRSEEEEDYISNYFLDGYDNQPGESSWMLSFKFTLGYFLFYELFTFGFWFPFSSTISSYTTPFYPRSDGYETVLSSPRHNNHTSTRVNHALLLNNHNNHFPQELERELEQKVARIDYIVTTPSSPPAPQNPQFVPSNQLVDHAEGGGEEQKQHKEQHMYVKAYPAPV
jgi:hypothetical protein